MSLVSNIFLKYKNPVYVETGTYEGYSLNMAIQAGFNELYSIDINEARQEENTKAYPYSKIITGDSAKILYDVIKDIRQPITFFLDAHWSGKQGDEYQLISLQEAKNMDFPLMVELDHIQRWRNETGIKPIIIVDDMRCWDRKEYYGFDVYSILGKLKDYTISYENGAETNDILVAQ